MKITDKEVLKELNRIRSGELEIRIEDYPEDERDGRSDWQVLADELSYLVSNLEEYGNVMHEDLDRSREILRETQNGKVMPLWQGSLTPKYRPSDIRGAKDFINEYRRLKNAQKRLNARGIYGIW